MPKSANETKIECDSCSKTYASSRWIRYCHNCGRTSCRICGSVNKYVDTGNEWVLFRNLENRKDRPKNWTKLPTINVCEDCLYLLDTQRADMIVLSKARELDKKYNKLKAKSAL